MLYRIYFNRRSFYKPFESLLNELLISAETFNPRIITHLRNLEQTATSFVFFHPNLLLPYVNLPNGRKASRCTKTDVSNRPASLKTSSVGRATVVPACTVSLRRPCRRTARGPHQRPPSSLTETDAADASSMLNAFLLQRAVRMPTISRYLIWSNRRSSLESAT